MLQILSFIAPIFGLIAVGFIAAKSRYMSEGAGRAVSELGFKVAVPALLFRAMLGIGEVAVSPFRLAATYLACVVVVWAMTALAARALLARPPADRPVFGMAVTFGNGVMLGFPVIVSAFGPEAATPLAILAVCDSIILWLIGTLHMEIALREQGRFDLKAFADVLRDVGRNPLVVALVSGAVCRFFGLTLQELPQVPARLIELIAQAGVPVSLIGIGMSLAGYRIRGELSAMALIMGVKLLVTPMVGLILATSVFGLPPLWAGVITVFLAMPVGANAFLFASRYDRAVAPVSASVALSTVLAVVTVTVVLITLQAQGFMAQLR